MAREKKKTKDIHIRIAEDDLSILKDKADKAKLSLTDYLTYCGIGKQIFIVDEFISQTRCKCCSQSAFSYPIKTTNQDSHFIWPSYNLIGFTAVFSTYIQIPVYNHSIFLLSRLK